MLCLCSHALVTCDRAPPNLFVFFVLFSSLSPLPFPCWCGFGRLRCSALQRSLVSAKDLGPEVSVCGDRWLPLLAQLSCGGCVATDAAIPADRTAYPPSADALSTRITPACADAVAPSASFPSQHAQMIDASTAALDFADIALQEILADGKFNQKIITRNVMVVYMYIICV